jgi:hypothetical protein
MPAKIFWCPIVAQEPLAVGLPDQFQHEMLRAFPDRKWPMVLIATQDWERIAGMAATSTMEGNPYVKLMEHLKRYKKINVWPVHGEEKE